MCNCSCGLVGGGGGVNFLKGMFFSMGIFFLFCISRNANFYVQRQHSVLSLEGRAFLEGRILLDARTSLEDRVPGGHDFTRGQGPLRTGLHQGTQGVVHLVICIRMMELCMHVLWVHWGWGGDLLKRKLCFTVH